MGTFADARPMLASERAHDPTVRLLDGFRLDVGDPGTSLPLSSQRLVAFLALTERPVLRSVVSGSLWPESDNDHAAGALRSAIWRARPGHISLVTVAGRHLALAPAVAVDLHLSMARARAILVGAADPDSSDIDLLSSDVLPDWYDDWVHTDRERHRQLRLHALEAISDSFLKSGRYGEALHAAMNAIAADPLRESANRRAIDVHLAEGNVGEAIRHFRHFADLLLSELRLRPSVALRERLGAFTD